jgi:hypothetical protein
MSENELLHCNNDYTCISDNDADDIKQIGVKSKFVCKLLLGTCGAKGCLASLS